LRLLGGDLAPAKGEASVASVAGTLIEDGFCHCVTKLEGRGWHFHWESMRKDVH